MHLDPTHGNSSILYGWRTERHDARVPSHGVCSTRRIFLIRQTRNLCCCPRDQQTPSRVSDSRSSGRSTQGLNRGGGGTPPFPPSLRGGGCLDDPPTLLPPFHRTLMQGPRVLGPVGSVPSHSSPLFFGFIPTPGLILYFLCFGGLPYNREADVLPQIREAGHRPIELPRVCPPSPTRWRVAWSRPRRVPNPSPPARANATGEGGEGLATLYNKPPLDMMLRRFLSPKVAPPHPVSPRPLSAVPEVLEGAAEPGEDPAGAAARGPPPHRPHPPQRLRPAQVAGPHRRSALPLPPPEEWMGMAGGGGGGALPQVPGWISVSTSIFLESGSAVDPSGCYPPPPYLPQVAHPVASPPPPSQS